VDGENLPAKRDRWKGTGDASLDAILSACGFDPHHLRLAHNRRVEALNAEDGAGRVDHATRLSAARDIFGMVGVSTSRKVEPNLSDRPVAVQIVLNGQADPRAALPTNGVVLHLSDGHGDPA
jgi:hypothetical protein